MDQVAAIPGTALALQQLGASLHRGELIAFVGAGASVGHYPTWSQLLLTLADEALARGLADEKEFEFWRVLSERRPHQAARAIRRALGQGSYAEVMRTLFAPRFMAKERYTSIQAALLRLPFAGHVTTNYDVGLEEARTHLRPEGPTSSIATWADNELVRGIRTGDAFGHGACPILHLHGVYDRPDTIVLTSTDFRRVYSNTGARGLLKSLWTERRLLFVGVGFSDWWQDAVIEEAIAEYGAEIDLLPRHFALVPLDATDRYVPEMRRIFQDQYATTVILYPTSNGDHSAARSVLDHLAGPSR